LNASTSGQTRSLPLNEIKAGKLLALSLLQS
jgi:hypothetical protein